MASHTVRFLFPAKNEFGPKRLARREHCKHIRKFQVMARCSHTAFAHPVSGTRETCSFPSAVGDNIGKRMKRVVTKRIIAGVVELAI